MNRRLSWQAPGAALTVLTVIVAGCTTPPPPAGARNGRVEVTDTTAAEANSREVQPGALVEFSDQVTQHLVEDMKQIPELNGPYRATVVFGDIDNKTGIVPTADFEAFRTRIRQKLMQSRTVLTNIRFVENRARMEALRNREGGGASQDLLQQNVSGSGGGDALNPQYTFFLNGDMYRVTRGTQEQVNLYMLGFQLTKMQDGEIVWENSPYEIKQARP